MQAAILICLSFQGGCCFLWAKAIGQWIRNFSCFDVQF